jgi:hypothetical protein
MSTGMGEGDDAAGKHISYFQQRTPVILAPLPLSSSS